MIGAEDTNPPIRPVYALARLARISGRRLRKGLIVQLELIGVRRRLRGKPRVFLIEQLWMRLLLCLGWKERDNKFPDISREVADTLS